MQTTKNTFSDTRSNDLKLVTRKEILGGGSAFDAIMGVPHLLFDIQTKLFGRDPIDFNGVVWRLARGWVFPVAFFFRGTSYGTLGGCRETYLNCNF